MTQGRCLVLGVDLTSASLEAALCCVAIQAEQPHQALRQSSFGRRSLVCWAYQIQGVRENLTSQL